MKTNYLLILLALIPACSASRENITASVVNTIGITLAQNETSQMYEAKAGYIRNQFYLIPTGKIIEKGPAGELQTVNAQADVTPEVVSASSVESGVEQLFIGIKSKELFAVGQYGVQSPAAVAMFLSNPSEGKASPDQVAAAGAVLLEQTPDLPPSPPAAVSPLELTPSLP
jgi:hypothetical protein